MNFHVLTLFPDMVKDGLYTSILKRAMDNGLIFLHTVNIRDYTLDKHKKTDDYPFGGGAGLLMQADPVFRAYEAVTESIAAPSIFLPRDAPSTSGWRRSFPKRKTWYFCAGITKGLTKEPWRKS